MNFAKRSLLICIMLISCVGCDQATKSVAVSMLPKTERFSYFGDTVRLQLVYNRGAFLSMGHSLPEVWRRSIFTIGTGLFLLGVLFFAFLSNNNRPSVILASALVFAGGVGNLLDRIAHNGVVVDFMNIGIGPVRTGIFNVADVAVAVGALIFLSAVLRRQDGGA